MIRKAKELVISTKMSSEWSKDQVLQSYLNIIYFGRGAYGIARRVQGVLRQTGRAAHRRRRRAAGRAHPAARRRSTRPSTPTGAAERWNWVLDGMVTIGALSPTDRAAQVFPPTVPPDQASDAEP